MTGLNPPSIELINQIHLHFSIGATFLRHCKFCKYGKQTVQEIIIEGKQRKLTYKPIKWYAHQTFAKQLCQAGQLLTDYISIISWLYLGATVRHAMLDKYNKIQEKPEFALVLLFVPVVCQYFIFHPYYEKTDNNNPEKYLIVIPEILDLEEAAYQRWQSGNLAYKNYHVSSLGEAALITYSWHEVETQRSCERTCQVLLYEKFNKDSHQRSLIETRDITINLNILNTYFLIKQFFQENQFDSYGKNRWIKVNFIRGIIADNLVKGVPWWSDFWKILNQEDIDGELAQQLIDNKEGLIAMIEQDKEMEDYKLFVQAFHEALRRNYAKIQKRTQEGERARFDREYERIRGELNRCYDEHSFSDFLADFLARAGFLSTLYDEWDSVLPFITESVPWQKARNIALFALATYKPVSKNQLEGE